MWWSLNCSSIFVYVFIFLDQNIPHTKNYVDDKICNNINSG